ncbi:MAG: glycoside hydrolase family 2, partial [Flavisolibacter sp.]|nr:glycoside hydrolase family 2 [Flavisolibacter sp.]
MKRILLPFFFILYCHTFLQAQQTIISYLSGTDKDHTVDWDFMVTGGRKSGKWTKIPVPSNWECQGFGEYHYGWEEDFKKNETGLYKYAFKTAPAWKNKTVKIVFEGSMTDTEVKINGKAAGPVHQGSFCRFKYNITDLLNWDKDNLLEVAVHKISSDTSVNRAERMSDFWVFGGIFRPVYLEVLPKQNIQWTAIDAKANGSFLINVYPENISDASTIEAQIKTLDGKPVGNPFSVSFKQDEEKLTLKTKVTGIKTWTPEFPNRYQVEVRLKNRQGVVHSITEKFGFRTVEFREGIGFFVNGVRVMFKGVNRHSAWPTSGRTMSKEISIMDVNLMKDMNMNAVRMSHYPPDAHFLDVCDSLGLFVLDELTGWQKKYDTPVGRKLLKEMVVKDVNHPSIIIWDNGNEGGNNFDLDDDFALYDPQKRHVIHPWAIFRGTDTQHYKGYDCCAGSLFHGNLIFFPTEMLHGLFDGGHGAGLNDHWNLMLSNPLSAGGFLWVFADEGVVRTDKNDSIDVKDNRAPDGILGPFREKEGSFYTIKEIWSPVYINNQKIIKGFDGVLDVENRYYYTNLNQIKFNWKLVQLPNPADNKTEGTILAQHTFTGPSLAPQQRGKLPLHLPGDYQKADVLYLTATDVYRRELFTWSWPLKTPQQINNHL